jgi:hypothetical protein
VPFSCSFLFFAAFLRRSRRLENFSHVAIVTEMAAAGPYTDDCEEETPYSGQLMKSSAGVKECDDHGE